MNVHWDVMVNPTAQWTEHNSSRYLSPTPGFDLHGYLYGKGRAQKPRAGFRIQVYSTVTSYVCLWARNIYSNVIIFNMTKT